MREHHQRGFTLIEVAIALVIIGLMISYALPIQTAISQQAAKTKSEQLVSKISQSLIKFSIRHHRLPCIDSTQDGYENCSSTTTVGSVPFNTIMMETPGAISAFNSGINSVLYSAYRNSAATADLAVASDISGDSIVTVDDLVRKLNNAINTSKSNNYTYVTGDNKTAGVENCASNNVSNIAFALAHGGGADRDGDLRQFDLVNSVLSAGTGQCFASPLRAEDAVYDDTVLAVSFTNMLGHIGSY